jgi:hypothetical protein
MIASLLVSLLITFLYPFAYSVVAAVINALFDIFTKPFNFNATGNKNWFAILLSPDLINVIIKIMISAGVVLAIFILAYNLFKLFFAGISKRAESPISLCFRALLAIFLCYWIVDIVYYVVFPMFQWFLDMVKNITVSGATSGFDAIKELFSWNPAGPDNGDIFQEAADKFGFVIAGNTLREIALPILLLIFTIKAMISMFKLVTEMAERYLLVNVLAISGPLVAPTIISNSTMEIFVSWTRMMIANSLVLVFNALGMIMIQAGFISLGVGLSSSGFINGITYMILFSALIKVVQKFDVYLAQLAFKIQAIGDGGRGKSALGILMMGASLAGRGSKWANRVADAGGLAAYTKANIGGLFGLFGGRLGNDTSFKLSEEKMINEGILYGIKKSVGMEAAAGSERVVDLTEKMHSDPQWQEIAARGAADKQRAKNAIDSNPDVQAEKMAGMGISDKLKLQYGDSPEGMENAEKFKLQGDKTTARYLNSESGILAQRDVKKAKDDIGGLDRLENAVDAYDEQPDVAHGYAVLEAYRNANPDKVGTVMDENIYKDIEMRTLSDAHTAFKNNPSIAEGERFIREYRAASPDAQSAISDREFNEVEATVQRMKNEENAAEQARNDARGGRGKKGKGRNKG